MSVRSGKLALWVIEILIQDFSIGFDLYATVVAITNCDVALLTGADVVVDCVEPLIGMFAEARDEDGFSARSSGSSLSLVEWERVRSHTASQTLQASEHSGRRHGIFIIAG